MYIKGKKGLCRNVDKKFDKKQNGKNIKRYEISKSVKEKVWKNCLEKRAPYPFKNRAS